jgi:hypothetical protein
MYAPVGGEQATHERIVLLGEASDALEAKRGLTRQLGEEPIERTRH